MSNLDRLRISLTTAKDVINDAIRTTDFMREPPPDRMPDLIRKINANGWRITIWQGNSGDWWVTLSGKAYIMSAIRPDPLMALQDALNKTVQYD